MIPRSLYTTFLCPPGPKQGLLFWLFLGGFKVSSGTVEWYRSSDGTDSNKSEIASPVKQASATFRPDDALPVAGCCPMAVAAGPSRTFSYRPASGFNKLFWNPWGVLAYESFESFLNKGTLPRLDGRSGTPRLPSCQSSLAQRLAEQRPRKTAYCFTA